MIGVLALQGDYEKHIHILGQLGMASTEVRYPKQLDNIEGLTYKKHMLHYNFPPYSVGEARPKFSVSRREIGHGNLAERAIKPSLPDFEDLGNLQALQLLWIQYY